jgi:hypothetical protein
MKTTCIPVKQTIASFIEGKSFLNSRQALREFKAVYPEIKVSEMYFYTLFKLFGTRLQKKEHVLEVINRGGWKNCMDAYKAYKTETNNPVAFAYFLNVWKKHFNIQGSSKVKKAKVEKENTLIISFKEKTARQILIDVQTHIGEHPILNISLKNKQKIVKEAIQLFKTKGFTVEA